MANLILSQAKKMILSHSNPEQAEFLSRFFKTGKGEYAEGDRFLGIRVPQSRLIAKELRHLDFPSLVELLRSEYHEMRLIALILFGYHFTKGHDTQRKEIYQLYCLNTNWINNWDLVDESAPRIPGTNLLDKDRSQLYKWSKSSSMWDRRIAMVSTLAFIRKGDFEDTFRLAERYLSAKEDLIHKASGWMIREVYKRSPKTTQKWIESHASSMPRTMLRYAIEKIPEKERKRILAIS